MSYWAHDTKFQANTKVRSEEANNKFDGIAASFAKLPSEAILKAGTATFGTDTGTANNYAVTLPNTLVNGYETGLFVTFKVLNTNTGASVVNVNGLGNKSIIRTDGDPVAESDIVKDAVVTLVYDGTQFQFVGLVQSLLKSITDSVAKAKQWADEALGVEVETGKFSSRHWAEQFSATAGSVYNWQGDWTAGTYVAGDVVYHPPTKSSYITFVTTTDEPTKDINTVDWQFLARAPDERTFTKTAVSKRVVDRESVVVTAATKTITALSSPVNGMEFTVAVGDFSDTVIDPDGENINGVSGLHTIDEAFANVTYKYIDATLGYRTFR